MPVPRPILLLILDGFGLRDAAEGNAVAAAKKPNFDSLWREYPHTALGASGLDVGLPDGQMGNSEVGHLNIGAGRIVYQDITRIDLAIKDGSFFRNEALLGAIGRAKADGSRLHLLGLVSDGGVHSSMEHIAATVKLAADNGAGDVLVHAFLDGRDTSPTGGQHYLAQLQSELKQIGIGRIASVSGRYYAMDRDQRWDRIRKAYDAIVHGRADVAADPVIAVKDSYRNDVTDEFVVPVVIADDNTPPARMESGDEVIFMNFRADRARQLSHALTDEAFEYFDRGDRPKINLTTMTLYDTRLKADVAFPQLHLENILGEVLAERGMKQLRIAETEKYAHVTFFFSGGREEPFDGEDRVLVNSPKVATYDLKPEMSAHEVAEKAVERIGSGRYDLVVLNFANCDMVGHTGIFPAAVRAVEAVDECLGKVVAAALRAGGAVLLTADHGNSETMIDEENGGPFTAHTSNPVPLILIDGVRKYRVRSGGKLADLAPTILELMRLPQPPEMTGNSLISRA